MEGRIQPAADLDAVAAGLFDRLAAIGADGVGITRETFGAGEGAAFDLVEAESELVAGFMVEYSSTPYLLFMLGEYVAIVLMCAMTTILFLGGWLSPVGSLPDGFHWLALKTAFILLLFLWARATFPRFRYDHIMRLGWKVFIPVTLVWVFVVALWLMSPLSIWS